MKVNLTSNSSTYFWKYFMPIIMASFLIYILYAFFFLKNQDFDFSSLLFLLPATIFSVYYAFRLSFVQGDNDFLYVKSYKKSDKIPLNLIEDVEGCEGRMKEISIYFKEETSFGKKITFVPYSKWFLFGSEHPVVTEVKAYLKNLNKNETENIPLD